VPHGVRVMVIGFGEAPPMLNTREVEAQLRRALQRLSDDWHAVEGEAVSIVMLDSEGNVRDVLPGSGNPDMDRVLRTFWRRPRFAPPVVSGCRVPAWVRVPLRFSIGPDAVQVQVNYPALPEPR
jgi:TonB family protein